MPYCRAVLLYRRILYKLRGAAVNFPLSVEEQHALEATTLEDLIRSFSDLRSRG